MLNAKEQGQLKMLFFLTNYNLNFLFDQKQFFENRKIYLFLWRDPVTPRHPPTRLRCSETTNQLDIYTYYNLNHALITYFLDDNGINLILPTIRYNKHIQTITMIA